MRPNDRQGRKNNPPSLLAKTSCVSSGTVLQSWSIFPTQVPPFLSALAVLSVQAEVHCLNFSFLLKGANEELVQGAQAQNKHGTADI